MDCCPNCSEPIPLTVTDCPHCGRAVGFPNVQLAIQKEQQERLQERYDLALAKASADGTRALVEQFEATCETSEAVICRYLGELSRLANSDDEIYATFYQRVDSGLRIPGGSTWDTLRAMADTALFGEQNKKHIRFAALSLDGKGLTNYGECSLVLKTPMIAHRSSVFEENSVIFMRKHGITAANDYQIPVGHMAAWDDRRKLCVAKLAGSVVPGDSVTTFPSILLGSGTTTGDDHFVEVHIWGSITIRSVREIRVDRWVTQPSDVEIQVLEDRLSRYSIALKRP